MATPTVSPVLEVVDRDRSMALGSVRDRPMSFSLLLMCMCGEHESLYACAHAGVHTHT